MSIKNSRPRRNAEDYEFPNLALSRVSGIGWANGRSRIRHYARRSFDSQESLEPPFGGENGNTVLNRLTA